MSLPDPCVFDGIPCLAALDGDARRAAAAEAVVHRLSAGDVVSPSAGVCFVRAGTVRVALPPDRNGEVAFRDVGPGGVFGDFEALVETEPAFTATALNPADLVDLPAAAFGAMLEAAPAVAVDLLRGHAREALAVVPRTPRAPGSSAIPLYRELLRLAEPDPQRPDVLAIAKLPRHRELADWTGMSEEDVAGAMAGLVRSRCVARRYPGLEILDQGRLRGLAAQ